MEPASLTSPARLAGRTVLRTQTDKRLVELVRAGSEPAFEAIVDRYRAPLRRYCGRLAPRSSVDDVVQHTFVSAYLVMTADGNDLELKPWLFRVTHNAAVDQLRRNARGAEQLDDSFAGADRLDTELESKARLRTLMVQLGDLPERQRAALVLRELEGRSRAEIAQEMGVSGGAVRQLLNRARTGLRAAASGVIPPWVFLTLGAKTDRAGDAERIAEVVAGPSIAVGAAKIGALVATTGAIGVVTVAPGGGLPTAPAAERPNHPNGAAIVRDAVGPGVTAMALRAVGNGDPDSVNRARPSRRGSDGGVAANSGSKRRAAVRDAPRSDRERDDDDDAGAGGPGIPSDDGDEDDDTGEAVARPEPAAGDDDEAIGPPGARIDDDAGGSGPGAGQPSSDDDDGVE